MNTRAFEIFAEDRRARYRLRMFAMSIAAACLAVGCGMFFFGLEGSFDWAFEAPQTITSKLTNASPGVLFVVAGTIVIWIALKPVNDNLNYKTVRNETKSNALTTEEDEKLSGMEEEERLEIDRTGREIGHIGLSDSSIQMGLSDVPQQPLLPQKPFTTGRRTKKHTK